jgi:nitrogen fixation protein FixH
MKSQFNLWPLGIVVVFVLFAAGLATAVVIAATHRDSLVSENYYEQELRFQNQIDSQTRAQASDARIVYDAPMGEIIVQLPGAQVVAKPVGKIELYRPANPGLDCAFNLAPGDDGAQSLDISQLPTGAWTVRVRWTAGGQDYFLQKKITVPAR